MSKRFDISANRIPHGLLEPAEREAIEAAAKVPGAAVVIYNAGRNAWHYCCPTWGEMFVYRVHLPAAPAEATVETMEHEGKRYRVVQSKGGCDGCEGLKDASLCVAVNSCRGVIFVEDAAPAPVSSDAPKPTRIEPLVPAAWRECGAAAYDKINELVDAFNELRKGGAK